MRYLAVVLGLAFVVGCQAPVPGGNTKRDGGSSPPDFAGQMSSGNCGGAAQMCCAGEVCDVGLQCNPKTGGCCAATGNACAGPQDCCAGLSCTAGKCCTAIGAACGAPGDCCSGLTCTGGVCDKPSGMCGDAGKACCMPGNTCTSGNVCVSGMCKACGAAGQACCDAMTCNKGFTCDSGTCNAPCGDTGQACCKTGMACKTSALMCDAPSQTCKSTTGMTTGGLNQPCTMPGNTCNSGLSCVANKCQMTSTCNTVGAACCSGNTCSGGLVCNTAMNKCQMPGSMCTAIQELCTATSQCCPNLTCTNTVQPDQSQKKSCCVGVGAACPDGDFDCCGYLTCISGKCTAGPDGDPCLTNDDCTSKNCASGTCAAAAGGCGSLKPVGSACTATSQCCNGGLCEIVTGASDPKDCCYGKTHACASHAECCGTLLCGSDGKCACAVNGSGCDQDDDCCSGLVCNSGTCRMPGQTMIPPGGACTSSLDCQDTNGTYYVCFPSATSSSDACCTVDWQIPCTSNASCCGPSICGNNGIAQVCCSDGGGSCNGSYDCCGAYICIDGTCQ
jgi:hypothetical protein